MKDAHKNLLKVILSDDVIVKPIDDAQRYILKKHYTNNIITSDIYITNEHIIFTSELVYNNWLYYAGLQYITDDTDLISLKSEGLFMAVCYAELSNRIAEILELICPI